MSGYLQVTKLNSINNIFSARIRSAVQKRSFMPVVSVVTPNRVGLNKRIHKCSLLHNLQRTYKLALFTSILYQLPPKNQNYIYQFKCQSFAPVLYYKGSTFTLLYISHRSMCHYFQRENLRKLNRLCKQTRKRLNIAMFIYLLCMRFNGCKCVMSIQLRSIELRKVRVVSLSLVNAL